MFIENYRMFYRFYVTYNYLISFLLNTIGNIKSVDNSIAFYKKLPWTSYFSTEHFVEIYWKLYFNAMAKGESDNEVLLI